MTTIYDYDLHALGEGALRRAIRDTYDPTASSLTRQAWAYQQELIDESGEGQMGQVDAPSSIPSAVMDRLEEVGLDRRVVSSCGAGLATAAFAGYVTGKVGLLPVAAGIGVAYLVLRGMDRG